MAQLHRMSEFLKAFMRDPCAGVIPELFVRHSLDGSKTLVLTTCWNALEPHGGMFSRPVLSVNSEGEETFRARWLLAKAEDLFSKARTLPMDAVLAKIAHLDGKPIPAFFENFFKAEERMGGAPCSSLSTSLGISTLLTQGLTNFARDLHCLRFKVDPLRHIDRLSVEERSRYLQIEQSVLSDRPGAHIKIMQENVFMVIPSPAKHLAYEGLSDSERRQLVLPVSDVESRLPPVVLDFFSDLNLQAYGSQVPEGRSDYNPRFDYMRLPPAQYERNLYEYFLKVAIESLRDVRPLEPVSQATPQAEKPASGKAKGLLSMLASSPSAPAKPLSHSKPESISNEPPLSAYSSEELMGGTPLDDVYDPGVCEDIPPAALESLTVSELRNRGVRGSQVGVSSPPKKLSQSSRGGPVSTGGLSLPTNVGIGLPPVISGAPKAQNSQASLSPLGGMSKPAPFKRPQAFSGAGGLSAPAGLGLPNVSAAPPKQNQSLAQPGSVSASSGSSPAKKRQSGIFAILDSRVSSDEASDLDALPPKNEDHLSASGSQGKARAHSGPSF